LAASCILRTLSDPDAAFIEITPRRDDYVPLGNGMRQPRARPALSI